MDLPPFPKFNQTGLVDSTWTCVAPKPRPPQQAVHPGFVSGLAVERAPLITRGQRRRVTKRGAFP